MASGKARLPVLDRVYGRTPGLRAGAPYTREFLLLSGAGRRAPGVGLTALPPIPNLRYLGLDAPGLTDLGFLNGLPPLRSFRLLDCADIDDHSPLLQSTVLHEVELRRCTKLRSLSQLPSLAEIETLSLRPLVS
jgi:hypothetical protein